MDRCRTRFRRFVRNRSAGVPFRYHHESSVLTVNVRLRVSRRLIKSIRSDDNSIPLFFIRPSVLFSLLFISARVICRYFSRLSNVLTTRTWSLDCRRRGRVCEPRVTTRLCRLGKRRHLSRSVQKRTCSETIAAALSCLARARHLHDTE